MSNQVKCSKIMTVNKNDQKEDLAAIDECMNLAEGISGITSHSLVIRVYFYTVFNGKKSNPPKT